jgi:hypothetical protein
MLLDFMFESVNTANSSLSYGIDVLLTLLEPRTSTYVSQFIYFIREEKFCLIISVLRIEFICDIKSLEQERLLKEQERILIADRGVKCVTEACISRLNEFYAILVKTDDIVRSKFAAFIIYLFEFNVNNLKLVFILLRAIARHI